MEGGSLRRLYLRFVDPSSLKEPGSMKPVACRTAGSAACVSGVIGVTGPSESESEEYSDGESSSSGTFKNESSSNSLINMSSRPIDTPIADEGNEGGMGAALTNSEQVMSGFITRSSTRCSSSSESSDELVSKQLGGSDEVHLPVM